MPIIPGGENPSGGATGPDGSPGAVLYVAPQTLTPEQMAQARVNIDAASGVDLTAEIAARVAADNALSAGLTAETNRATAAEGAVQTNLNTHAARTDNPHGVTKAQILLGNVDNTSDASKPVSTAQAAALAAKADLVAGKLNPTQLPDLAISEFLGSVASQAAMLALTGQRGDWCVRSDDGKMYILNADTPSVLASWTAITYPNQLVANAIATAMIQDGAVTLAKLANIAQATVMGRAAGAGTGVPVALNASQIRDIIAGDVGAGTAGEVATFDAAGKAVRGSSKTVAAASSFASATELTAGDDLRLGATEGASFTIGGTGNGGGLTPVSGFTLNTLQFDLRTIPSTTAILALFATTNYTLTTGLYCAITGTTPAIRVYDGNGAGGVTNGSLITIPTGARVITVQYVAATYTFSFFADGASSAFGSHVRANSTLLDPITTLFRRSAGDISGYLGTCRNLVALNYQAAQADRIAYINGETPVRDLGGTPRTAWTGAWTDNNFTSGGGTITVNSAGTLTASCPSATGVYALEAAGVVPAPAPILRPGRVIRLRYDLTVNSGVAPYLKFQQGNIETAVRQLVAGTGVVTDFTVTAGFSAVTNAQMNLKLETGGASNFSLSSLSIEYLGAQILVGPADWTSTRAADTSGNCNDLIYGTGVRAASVRAYTRVISATVAGSVTLTASAAPATLGAASGALYADKQALLALRQYDAVSGAWGQSRPANAGAPIVTVTTSGAASVDGFALGGSQSIVANAAVKIIHNLQ